MGEQDVKQVTEEREQRAFMKGLLDDLRALEQMLETGMVESGIRRMGVRREGVNKAAGTLQKDELARGRRGGSSRPTSSLSSAPCGSRALSKSSVR
jgi:hypothetical protein